ncbi:MAG: nucleotide sugar dehydrogenase [Nocardioidaceae bacterium]
MRIAVVGLGKIGLPLAVQYASRGHQVVGVDVSERTVALVNDGVEPYPGEADLARLLGEAVAVGLLSATTSYDDGIRGADAVVVVVPLVVDTEDQPDFGMLDGATRDIAAHLGRGTLVVYETTMPVGVTRGRWLPMLEQGSGLTEGADFHLAYSPERVLTGRVFADLRKYPKVIGAFSAEGSRRTTEFYEAVLEFDERADLERPNGVWDLGTPEAAELTKLAETTYRDVNIALANQFAKFAEGHGIDVYQVIAAANSQPYSHIHRPGISVGGHCIPVYPRLYLWGDPDADLVRTARRVNAGMPAHAVALLEREVGSLDGLRVGVLGATYRPGVRETAFSGVFDVVAELRSRGADALVHDTLLSADELDRLGLPPYAWGEPVDAAILHTDHPDYLDLGPDDLPGCKVLVDGRATGTLPELRPVRLGRGGPDIRSPHSGA